MRSAGMRRERGVSLATGVVLILLSAACLAGCGATGGESGQEQPSPENFDRGFYVGLVNRMKDPTDEYKKNLTFAFADSLRVDEWSLPRGTFAAPVPPGASFGTVYPGFCPLCFQASTSEWAQWIDFRVFNTNVWHWQHQWYFNFSGRGVCRGAGGIYPYDTHDLFSDVYSTSDETRACAPDNMPVSMVVALQESGNCIRGMVEIWDKFVLPARSDWMKELGDAVLVKDISIPGTHDSAAWSGHWYDPRSPWAQTQTKTFREQLEWGARAFDLRLDQCMHFYHGTVELDATLDDFLNEAASFLRSHQGEFIIAFVSKENCSGSCSGIDFNDHFRGYASRHFPFVDALGVTHDIRYAWDPVAQSVGNLASPAESRLRGNLLVMTRPGTPRTCGFIQDTPQMAVPENATDESPPGGTVPVAVSDEYNRKPQNKIENLVRHLARATEGKKWHWGYTSLMPDDWPWRTPAGNAAAFNPALWRYMVQGQGWFPECRFMEGCTRSTWEDGLPAVPRDGPLGTVMMDFIGSYQSNEIRDDMLRRNLSLKGK